MKYKNMPFSENPNLESEQKPEFSSEELKRREEMQSLINSIVFENYWKSVPEVGRHVIAMGAESIAAEIHRRYGGDEKELQKIVLECILNSPSSADIKPGAIEILAEAVSSGEFLYIWTVGDEGSYTDEKRKITYPAYDFQRRKISGSRILDRLNEEIPRMGDDEVDASDNVILSINARNKREALHEAMVKFRDSGVQHVYIVDDHKPNLENIDEISREVGGLTVHTYWINNESDKGDLPACRQFILERRNEHNLKGERMGLILDWDNTLYDEPRRVARSAQKIADELLKTDN